MEGRGMHAPAACFKLNLKPNEHVQYSQLDLCTAGQALPQTPRAAACWDQLGPGACSLWTRHVPCVWQTGEVLACCLGA